MKVIQVRLMNENKETFTTWVDVRPNLKQGSLITLKDFKPDTKWTVVDLYPTVHESTEFDWHRKWDNNI